MVDLDARHLSPAAQEDLRRRVIQALRSGMKKVDAAATFGVSRQAVQNWAKRYGEGGSKALAVKKRGRPKQPRLKAVEIRETKRLIQDHCPDQLKLPFMLWTREAVCELLRNRYGLSVSVWTAGRYLKSWGFTPQKPVRRAFEQNPAAVKRWLEEEYPAIARAAKRAGAEIYWGDEMGLRSDHQTGTSYGLKGRTPVIPGTGQRFRCNMISAVTNRGKLGFMVFKERFTAGKFIEFLRRLVRHAGRLLYLIVDGHPVHRSSKVGRWLRAHEGKIRMFWLPSYSPELNPDELLNQDVKSNALGRRRPLDQGEMVDGVRSYLRGTQKRPEIVCNYFREKHVRYAA
jgi:transposase